MSISINPPRMKKTCSLVGFSVAKLEVSTICKVYVKAIVQGSGPFHTHHPGGKYLTPPRDECGNRNSGTETSEF